jgi:hypothetical protein
MKNETRKYKYKTVNEEKRILVLIKTVVLTTEFISL